MGAAAWVALGVGGGGGVTTKSADGVGAGVSPVSGAAGFTVGRPSPTPFLRARAPRTSALFGSELWAPIVFASAVGASAVATAGGTAVDGGLGAAVTLVVSSALSLGGAFVAGTRSTCAGVRRAATKAAVDTPASKSAPHTTRLTRLLDGADVTATVLSSPVLVGLDVMTIAGCDDAAGAGGRPDKRRMRSDDVVPCGA